MAMYSENMMMIHVPMDRPVYISLSMQGMEMTGDMPRIGLAGKRHAHGHEKQAGTVAENAFAHLQGLLFRFTALFPFWKHLLSGS